MLHFKTLAFSLGAVWYTVTKAYIPHNGINYMLNDFESRTTLVFQKEL